MVSITSSYASWTSAPAEGLAEAEDIGTHREVVTGTHLASAAAPCLDLESEVGVAVTPLNQATRNWLSSSAMRWLLLNWRCVRRET
jgi:hypothetical protein